MGKVAFITGASRGLGAATALELARAGYDLALTARTVNEGEQQQYGLLEKPISLPGSLNEVAAQVRALGADVLVIKSDILDPESVETAVSQTLQHFGKIDLLFNNACYQGDGNQERLLEVTPKQVLNIYQGNVFTPLRLVQKVLPGMIERNTGCIVNMVSGSALVPPPAPADEGGWGFAYSSSKAALIRMIHSIRVENRDCNIRAFNIEPGFVVTEVMKASGLDKIIQERVRPTAVSTTAKVVRWLSQAEDISQVEDAEVISTSVLAAELRLE